MKTFQKAALAILGLGAAVSIATGQATTTLSAADRAILSAIRAATETLAGLVNANNNIAVEIEDSNGNAVVWAPAGVGALQSATTVSTTAATCFSADTTARERMIKSVATNTADIYFALDDDNSPTLTAANAPKVLHPGDEWTTGNNGYTGAIICLAASGSQSLARGVVR